jgi:hypothetical protein
MILQSNINSKNKIHDVILYEPIERQIYKELEKTHQFSYTINNGYNFIIEHATIDLLIKNGKILVSINPCTSWESGKWYDIKPYNTTLKVNVDIQKNWKTILDYVDNINNFQNEYLALLDLDNKKQSDIAIENELGSYFNNDDLEVKYYSSFSGKDFSFSITRKTYAPADGVYYTMNERNVATATYKDMENLIHHFYLGNDITSLRKKMEIISYIEDKIANFDLSNFPLSLSKYNYCQQVKNLITKFNIKSRY